MNNIYHSDIYQFDTPVSSYWEDTSSENLQIDKLKKDINTLIAQLSKERTNSEAIQDEQDETIAQLREELEKQKSITERIMNHLGIAKINK